ncbi:MAG TPA: hypothetical protein VKG23_17470 [Thermoanaerobaculia bacterium]|nr:hypothetical protein [Thermoanaerobaculia bacterium]
MNDLRYWHVVASDRRGAQWGFLVPGEQRPSVATVTSMIKKFDRVVELSGQIVDGKSLDSHSIQVVGSDEKIRRVKGAAPRHSIEGDVIA